LEAIDYLRGKQIFDKIASATLPGLLLLNLRMPRLNGFGVLAWLRMHPHLRPANVVVFSSSPVAADVAHARTLGADHYLLKPDGESEFAAFIVELERLLGGPASVLPTTTSSLRHAILAAEPQPAAARLTRF
jgi:CheY-like chemotaxis protein